MFRRLRLSRRLASTASATVAVVLWLVYSVPPSRVTNNSSLSGGHIARGVVHVHSQQSDGGGTIVEIAEAAREVGLDFVVVTDHGNGTRGTRSRYYEDILIVEGVEISTSGGHYIAVGHEATPYPLGGDAKGVVEDVRRFGGLGIVAHPNSARPELRWKDLTLPVDGVEWINGDSQWRGSGLLAFAKAVTWYWLKPTESLGMLLRRPTQTMNEWLNRQVFGVGGVDAHARLLFGKGGERTADSLAFSLPSYETMFGLFDVRVSLDEPLSGFADRDALILLERLKKGRSYIVVDAYGEPGNFEFFAKRPDSGELVQMGDVVEQGSSLTFTARIAGATEVVIRLLRDGIVLKEKRSTELKYSGDDFQLEREDSRRGEVFWVEIFRSDVPWMPWIISNPIRVEDKASFVETSNGGADGGAEPLLSNSWFVERSTEAEASGFSRSGGFVMNYKLGEVDTAYVAAVHDIAEAVSEGAVRLSVATDKPMRLSLQLRDNEGKDSRWRSSFFVDTELREINIPLAEFSAVTDKLPEAVPVNAIDDLLVVVDRVNAMPGSSGSIQIGTLVSGAEGER